MTTTPEDSLTFQELEETMHFFRQYAAQSQIESLSDANGWGIHPDSHECNILGAIAVGDKRSAGDILPDSVGLQETADVLEMRRAQFDEFYDQRLVRFGAERFEKEVNLYFRQLGAQYSYLKQGYKQEDWEDIHCHQIDRSHADYVQIAIANGDRRDTLDIFTEATKQLGGSQNIEMRMMAFQDQRADTTWIAQGWNYHELLQLTQEQLIERAHKRGIVTVDCGPEGFTVEDYIWRMT